MTLSRSPQPPPIVKKRPMLEHDNGFVFKLKKPKKVIVDKECPPVQNKVKHIVAEQVIALPVSDTPRIERNKEMRTVNGRRRSSLGLRGKRITLGNDGLCPPPHDSIEPGSYYRHIDSEQSDPVRMRQLLLWCGQKAIKKSKDKDVLEGLVEQVQDKILQDLVSKRINTSWYHRPTTIQQENTVLPHPGNISNLKQLTEFEASIERLQVEKESWESLIKTRQAEYNARQASELAIPILSEEQEEFLGKESPNLNEFDEWVSNNTDSLVLEIHRLQSLIHKAQVFESNSKKTCEALFSLILKGYTDKEKNEAVIDPMDMLKLLTVAKTE